MNLSAAEIERAEEVRRLGLTLINTYYHPILKDPSRTFRQTAEKWQFEHFIEPEFNPAINRIYIEAGRDFDKTGLIAAAKWAKHMANDIINAKSGSVKMPMRTRVHASDQDQSKVILDAIREKILLHHPEFVRNGDVVDEKNVLKFKSGVMSNEASEFAGAVGKRATDIVFEEMHTCNKPSDSDLWNVLDTKGEQKITINTNAGGAKKGLCWMVRESIRTKSELGYQNVHFFTSAVNPWLPSWLNEADVRARESVPEAIFNRFHLCRWGAGDGDVFTEEQINAAKRKSKLCYVSSSEFPTSFALDYGPKHNWTALSGCQGHSDGVYKMYKNIWIPDQQVSGQVQISDVKSFIQNVVNENFYMQRLDIETYQMISMIQELMALYGEDVVFEWTPTEQNVIQISMNIFQLFSNFRFFFPSNDNDFENDLRNCQLAPASGRNGTKKDDFKIMFKDLGEGGHGDDFRATAIAALNCTQNYSRAAKDILQDIHVVKSSSDGIASGGRRGSQSTPFDNVGSGYSPFGRGSNFDYN